MISNETLLIILISILVFFLAISIGNVLYYLLTRKRNVIMGRLKEFGTVKTPKVEDELERPFLDRTLGAFSKWLVNSINGAAPKRVMQKIDDKLENAGRPQNLKASDFLAVEGIVGIVVFLLTWFLLKSGQQGLVQKGLMALSFSSLGIYLPWFILARVATQRQRLIRKNLPDIMDLLVVSVEAGLAFDLALVKVVEKYKGPMAKEFTKVLQEMHFGKPRRAALKDMADRVNISEVTSLVNAVIQSEQLGVGLGNVLRIQSDLIREKRQQWIEEQAMKAPIKMLFPLVFFIFPSIFIVILGPAVLNIMKVLGGM